MFSSCDVYFLTRSKKKPSQAGKQTTQTNLPSVESQDSHSHKGVAGNTKAKQISDKNRNAVQRPLAATNETHKGPKYGPLKRGQKSKLKKIKQKYGEQDEDERQIRMVLLQVIPYLSQFVRQRIIFIEFSVRFHCKHCMVRLILSEVGLCTLP